MPLYDYQCQQCTNRFTELEESFNARGIALRDASLKDMETEWQRIKNSRS